MTTGEESDRRIIGRNENKEAIILQLVLPGRAQPGGGSVNLVGLLGRWDDRRVVLGGEGLGWWALGVG